MPNALRSLRTLAILAGALALAGPASAARRPNTASFEYQRSWGLEAIRAQSAHAAGLSGRGISIALIDCGIVKAQREVRRNVSRRRSVDLNADRTINKPLDRHGTMVAGPLGAALNGGGMVGLAYNATLVSIRADFDGGLNGECAFYPRDLARALDHATAQRARVVMLPVQGRKPLGEAFEAALERLIQSGAVVVIAAGNGSASQPTWPARYATDPRYAGSIVAVGATGWDGAITRWSNRAGPAQAYFITAPGEWIITDCWEKCAIVSGTSFATPYVAGALALVMEAHPDLTGPQAVERILQAGRDAGDPETDPIYGRGILDLSRAFPAEAARR